MYYHITDPINIPAIEAEGLHANEDGRIYLFTDPIVENTIARDQLFLDCYALIEVDYSGKVVADDVAEMSASRHAVAITGHIAAASVRVVDIYETLPWTDWDSLKLFWFGCSREQVTELRQKAVDAWESRELAVSD